jgi:phosphoribosylformylglycinamidine cyclo-ligase
VAADTPDLLGGENIGEALLRVHVSYLDHIQALVSESLAHGFAHITGGGIVGNTSRIIPEGLSIDVHWDSWARPPIFRLIQDVGSVPEDDMRQTFNLGVGLVAIVSPESRSRALAVLGALGEPAFEIGRVVSA